MKQIKYTLLGDGVSDRRLMPILTWLLMEHLPNYAIQPQWGDLSRLPRKPVGLAERIKACVTLYPSCDVLFIHRDAENQPHHMRIDEILLAKAQVAECDALPIVCVIPVRMQEAWLLIDEAALRRAVGNPHGKDQLNMPPIRTLESRTNPKEDLYQLMHSASGLSAHRRGKMPLRQFAYRLAEEIASFAPLRNLAAFRMLEADLLETINAQDW